MSKLSDKRVEEIKYSLVGVLFGVLVVGLVYWLVGGLVYGLVYGLVAGVVLGLVVGVVGGLVLGLAGGLVYWLVAGLVAGLGITFITNFIALMASNPEFVMFDLVVSGILLLIVQVAGWIAVWKLKKGDVRDE